MKKTKKNKNRNYLLIPPFTGIEHKITNSAPWRKLKVGPRWLYFELRKKCGGGDRAYIHFTWKEAKELMAGMVGKTFEGYRNKLIEYGFIDVVDRGGIYGLKAVFALSDRWKKWGKKDFIVVDIDKLFPKDSHFFKEGHQLYRKK